LLSGNWVKPMAFHPPPGLARPSQAANAQAFAEAYNRSTSESDGSNPSPESGNIPNSKFWKNQRRERAVNAIIKELQEHNALRGHGLDSGGGGGGRGYASTAWAMMGEASAGSVGSTSISMSGESDTMEDLSGGMSGSFHTSSLVWCHERSHKQDKSAVRKALGSMAKANDAALVCLKKALRFSTWVRQCTLPYVLVSSWREVKPCVSEFSYAGEQIREPGLIVVLCEQTREYSNALNWAMGKNTGQIRVYVLPDSDVMDPNSVLASMVAKLRAGEVLPRQNWGIHTASFLKPACGSGPQDSLDIDRLQASSSMSSQLPMAPFEGQDRTPAPVTDDLQTALKTGCLLSL